MASRVPETPRLSLPTKFSVSAWTSSSSLLIYQRRAKAPMAATMMPNMNHLRIWDGSCWRGVRMRIPPKYHSDIVPATGFDKNRQIRAALAMAAAWTPR